MTRPGRPRTRCGASVHLLRAYEDLVDANRGMLPIFRSTGMKINYVESRDGHSWESWRDQLGPGLCWLFPGDPGALRLFPDTPVNQFPYDVQVPDVPRVLLQ